MHRFQRLLVALAVAGMLLGPASAWVGGAQAADREFTLVNIEFEGTKVWVPGPLVVKKGDKVKIRAINKVKSDPAEHGLAIPEFGVKLEVKRDKPETVEFVADRAGIFKIDCHLHAPHVGTQLIVQE